MPYAGNKLVPGLDAEATPVRADLTVNSDVAVNADLKKVTWSQVLGLMEAADISDAASGIATWLVTPSSANLAAALTDESGSGVVLFGTITGIASGEILKWNGSTWINNTLAEAGISATGHSHVINDITDWGTNVATFLATPTSANLAAALTDESGSGAVIFATITGIVSGEILKWNGSNWINNTLAEAGISAVGHTHAASDVTSGTFADARIAESNVTQHQAALTITESQISDLTHYTHPNHTGDVTSVGDGATTIADEAVTLAKMQHIATDSFLGRDTAGTGDVEVLSAATVRTIINVEDGANNYSHPNHTGDVTSVGDGATTVANNAVTYAKMQDVSAASRLLGRGDSGSGDPQELSLGSGLSITGTTLDTTGAAGDSITINAAAVINADFDDSTPAAPGGDLNVKWQVGAGTNPNDVSAYVDVSALEPLVNHDNLTGFVANEHLDWTQDQGANNIHVNNITSVPETAVTAHEAALTITESQISDLSHYTHPNHSGDVTSVGDGATTIANNAVTYAKMQDVSAGSRLLGRGDSGSGDPEELSLGSGLSISGTTLDTTGAAGDTITINSAAVIDADFNDSTPSAPAGDLNVKWQVGAGTNPNDVSAYVDVSVLEPLVDHDNLTGFVANEHLDWTQDQGANNIHVNNITAVPETAVTAHEAALTITESQISDLSHTAPGGSDGNVQYNNGGAFGGFGTWDDTNENLTITNALNNAAVNVLALRGNRSSPTDGDEITLNGELEDSVGGQATFTQIAFEATTVLSSGKYGTIDFRAQVNNTMTEILSLNGTETVLNETGLDMDVRMEANGPITHAFFLQGSDGYIGMGGISGPLEQLHINGNLQFQGSPNIKSTDGVYKFVPSATNTASLVRYAPTGTEDQSSFLLDGDSDPSNTHRLEVIQDGKYTLIRNEVVGTGSAAGAREMHLQMSGTSGLTMDANAEITINQQLIITSGTSSQVAAAGEVHIDTNGDGVNVTTGVFEYHDGSAVRNLFGVVGYPSSDNDVMAFDSATNTVTWQAQSAGAGDSITINTTAVINADFDDSTPSAPAGDLNVKWQVGAGTNPNDVSAYVDVSVLEPLVNHDNLAGFVANEHIDWTGASSALVTSSTGTFDDLLLYDTDATNTLTLHWAEDETVNRTFNFQVNGAARTLNMSGDLAVSSTATVSGTNTGDVTLGGTPDYITISGQTITRNAIDLTADVTGDLPVADGGTGRSSATAYAVLCGGTTSTAAHQSVASVGTSGQVLTSNGAGSLPTFQAAAAGDNLGNHTATTNLDLSGNNIDSNASVTLDMNSGSATTFNVTNLGVGAASLTVDDVVTANSLKLQDTAANNTVEFKINEDQASDRTLDITLGAGNRAFAFYATAGSKLLGRDSGAGSWEELSLDATLAITAYTLGVVAASDTTAGAVELATIAETDTGTDTLRAVTPDGLNGSIHGAKYITIYAIDFSTALTTGDGKAYFRIPDQLDGMNLIDAHAQLGAAQSTSGTPTIQITRGSFSTPGGARTWDDMLTTRITIDANEWDSKDAASQPSINGSNDDVSEGDLIRVDVDVAGTGAQGLFVTLGFRNP